MLLLPASGTCWLPTRVFLIEFWGGGQVSSGGGGIPGLSVLVGGTQISIEIFENMFVNWAQISIRNVRENMFAN